MSRMTTAGPVTLRPVPNVYTALAFISMFATGVALGFVIWQFHTAGVL